MPKASMTVETLMVQVAAIRRDVDDLRTLVRDVLGQMIAISQAQAEANLRFIKLVEQEALERAALIRAAQSGGSTRPYTEEDEARQWRETLDARNALPAD